MRISDDNLNSQLNAMRAMIRRARKAGTDTIDAEKELCWLEREHELRELRKRLHEKYMVKMRAELELERQREHEALKEYETQDYSIDADVRTG